MPRPTPRPTPAERFEQNVDRGGPLPLVRGVHGRCWIWTGGTNEKGYGRFWHNRRATAAHRYAVELADGQPVPAALDVDHRCRNRACIRRSHLRAVTHRENILASSNHVARRAAVRACPAGHPYDDANTYRARNGTRKCRTCRREQGRARRAAAREQQLATVAPLTTTPTPTPERQAA
ncbi:HNH endonuclease signature motif containing protein [Streptomyces sp. NPDC007063]|uniref:HNH endonuclease signature motif containing protein n=1 Tax=Streptomyces sp. NPDC007063 TaxID=3364772 RepID=UPI0036A1A639